MDSSEIFWRWLTGLVRRVSVGVLLYFLFAMVSVLLYLSEGERNSGLDELSRYSNEHTRYTEAFADIARYMTALGSSKSTARIAIQPLRLSLMSDQIPGLPEFACAGSWVEGLRRLQSIPADLAARCARSEEQCQVTRERLLLDDLVAFERGIASVQDAVQVMDRYCNRRDAYESICGYYLSEGNEIAALNSFVGSYYRERPSRPAGGSEQGLICDADRASLTGAARLVAEIDPTARPRTLADFERLGRTVSDARVAIQSQDTRMSGAPPGGIMTVSIPKQAGLPTLALFGLLAALYAILQIRRLKRLVLSYRPTEGDDIFRLYPVASSAFTIPVFGGAGGAPGDGNGTHLAAVLNNWLFDHIPLLAWALMVFSIGGLTYVRWNGGTQLSLVGIGLAWLFLILQAAVIVGFYCEQRAVRAHFIDRIGDAPAAELHGNPKAKESEDAERS